MSQNKIAKQFTYLQSENVSNQLEYDEINSVEWPSREYPNS